MTAGGKAIPSPMGVKYIFRDGEPFTMRVTDYTKCCPPGTIVLGVSPDPSGERRFDLNGAPIEGVVCGY